MAELSVARLKEPLDGESSTSEEPRTILDLSHELLVKIIEHKCISLEDRKNLRLTCKAMVKPVADSEFFCDSTLVIKQSIGAETTIDGLFPRTGQLDNSCHEAFAHHVSRFFRRAYFDDVEIKFCVAEDGINVCQLLKLLEFIASINKLDVSSDKGDDRLFDIIAALKPRTQLSIRLIDQMEDYYTGWRLEEGVLALPAVPKIIVDAGLEWRKLSNATLLALIAKHPSVHLDWSNNDLEPGVLTDVVKVIAERGHFLSASFHFESLLECLEDLGVEYNGLQFFSQDPCTKISMRANELDHEYNDYTINVNGTAFTMYRIRPPQYSNSTIQVEFGKLVENL